MNKPTIKVGDRVQVVNDFSFHYGKLGTVVPHEFPLKRGLRSVRFDGTKQVSGIFHSTDLKVIGKG